MATTDIDTPTPDLQTSVGQMRAGEGHVFVIGATGQQRLTVCSQQTRALNLIYWLYWQKRQLRQPEEDQPDLVVIGAGIAGLTAAAAAARLDKKVWVLEAHEQPLALQRGCRHRLLHPHFYEWPEKGCWKMSAGLPILDWEEAIAADVADRIWGQFKAIADDKGIKMYTSVLDVQVEGSMQDPYVTWTTSKGESMKAHPPVVILAVGFGVEKTVPDLPVLSYWRDDPLDQAPLPRRTGEYIQIVSGTGDGGLVDVLRAALKNVDHVQFFSSVAAITRGSVLEEHLREMEGSLKEKTPQQAADILTEGYERLNKIEDDKALKGVEDLIKAHKRKNHKVIWLHQDESPWNWKTMCLNRFLVSRVMHVDENLVKPTRGTLLSSKLVDPELSGGFSFVACVLGPHKKAEAILAHGVTVRHGAKPALDEFKNVSEAWKEAHRRSEDKVQASDILKPKAHWKKDFVEKLKPARSSITPELRVQIVEEPNPVTVEGGDSYYRLRAYLHNAPQDVWRVTYDLHPSWGRRMERPVTKGESPTCKPFAKLLHTDTGVSDTGEPYEVRIRLNDGSEITADLVCAICREYCGKPPGDAERKRARDIVDGLCPRPARRPCERKEDGKGCVLG